MKKQMNSADLVAVGELIAKLRAGLCDITGAGINVRLIGETMPGTELDGEQICYELLFPCMGKAVTERADACFLIVDELERQLKTNAASATDNKNHSGVSK